MALPGLEFYHSAPGREIQSGSRFLVTANRGAAAVPASGTVLMAVVGAPALQWGGPGFGWLLEQSNPLIVIPSDTTGQLVITDAALFIQGAVPGGAQTFLIFFGTPIATTLTPRATMPVLECLPQIVTANDVINVLGLQAGTAPDGNAVSIGAQVTFHNNDAVNPHSVNVQLRQPVRAILGLTE